jgi:hypothetical protein
LASSFEQKIARRFGNFGCQLVAAEAFFRHTEPQMAGGGRKKNEARGRFSSMPNHSLSYPVLKTAAATTPNALKTCEPGPQSAGRVYACGVNLESDRIGDTS